MYQTNLITETTEGLITETTVGVFPTIGKALAAAKRAAGGRTVERRGLGSAVVGKRGVASVYQVSA